MLDLQRRLFGGNRIYWRDTDFERIATKFGVSLRELCDVADWRTFLTPEIFEAKASALNDGEHFRFILSSDTVDSYGDTIDQKGWDYSRVDKNFPVLAFHDGKSAIGQWSQRMIFDGKLQATFAHASASGYAQFVVGQLRERTLRASSVGFVPGEWEWSTDPKRKWGIDFKQGHVLLEASIVSIPANPDALMVQHVPGKQLENGSSETKPAPKGAKSSSLDLARVRAAALQARI